jgi:hypothetical protein
MTTSTLGDRAQSAARRSGLTTPQAGGSVGPAILGSIDVLTLLTG